MLYRTCEHYLIDSDIDEVKEEKKECFICFDHETNDKIIMKLKNLHKINYYKKCKCDGLVHLHCLEKWCNLQNKCPICRVCIVKSYYFLIDINIIDIHYGLYFIIYRIVQLGILIFKVCCFLWSIYFCYEYCSLLNIKTKNYFLDNDY